MLYGDDPTEERSTVGRVGHPASLAQAWRAALERVVSRFGA